MVHEPLVSVCMITYNHEAYVSEAIEGVLKQKTTFPIELVIGEDRSTDRTREICLEYERKFPDTIRVLPREKNLGMSEGFRDTFSQSKGEFIALCEGDDYWTNVDKLQTQVDFLSGHPDFSISLHESKVIYEKSDTQPHNLTDLLDGELTFQDVVNKKFHIATASWLFRKSCLDDLPERFPFFDWALLLVIGSKGKINFSDSVMSNYRKHGGGWTSFLTVERAWEVAEFSVACRDYFSPLHVHDFNRLIAKSYADVCFTYFEMKDYSNFATVFDAYRAYWKYLPRRTWLSLVARWIIKGREGLIRGYETLFRKKAAARDEQT